MENSMNKNIVGPMILLFSSQSMGAVVNIAYSGQQPVTGSFIVVYEDNVLIENKKSVLEKRGAHINRNFNSYLNGMAVEMPVHLVDSILRSDADIKYVENNGVVWIQGKGTDKGPKPQNGGRTNNSIPQVTPWGVVRVGGAKSVTGKRAWVLDTGVDLDNSDLVIGDNVNFLNDRKGKANNADDRNGHGTHVAGIIAAIDNEIDSVGVSPGAEIMPIRVLDDSGFGTVDSVVAGLEYVFTRATAGEVVNLSLATKGHYQSIHDLVIALAEKGVKVVVAAGNYAEDARMYEPAHIEHTNVYTVSAFGANDKFSAYSNYGNPPIDYSQPGDAISSLAIGGGVAEYSGTSMAAPHLAGILLHGDPNNGGLVNGDPDGYADLIGRY